METRANYVLIGAFTVLATVCLLLFALWATKFSADRNWRKYEVVFTEPVTGLTEGGSVQYNGIGVGTVDKLSLDHDEVLTTIVESAVAMKRALPSPHPARNPITASTVPLVAHRRAKSTMRASPISSVRFAPMRLETQLVTSMARPVTAR